MTDPKGGRADSGDGPEDSTLLRLTDIHYRWRPNRPEVLAGVSLSLPAGTVSWLGGQNGVGKTTLLRVAAGILVPRSGSVTLMGLHARRDRGPYQRQLGFLSAGDRGLYARMSVSQHLNYWSRLAYVPRDERAGLIAGSLRDFELEALADRRVDRISMGQRQRVRLAMAFLHRPAVILLDEPRNSLDEDGYKALQTQVSAAVSRNAAVLWCSPRGEEHVLKTHASYSLVDGELQWLAG